MSSTPQHSIERLLSTFISKDETAIAIARLVLHYYRNISLVNRKYPSADEDSFWSALSEKETIYRRYWLGTVGDRWKPATHGETGDYDLERLKAITVMSDLNDRYLVRISFKDPPTEFNNHDVVYLLDRDESNENGTFRIAWEYTDLNESAG